MLDLNVEVAERARAQAGNRAHALKTSLATLGQAARKVEPSEIPALVGEQVQVAERQMHWHLARARAAATQQVPGQRTALEPVLASLLRAMDKLHADRLNAPCTGHLASPAGTQPECEESRAIPQLARPLATLRPRLSAAGA